MYAIVDIAGQQFKVEKDQKIFVHRLENKEGSVVDFDRVLLIDNDGKIQVGTPTVKNAVVTAKVISHLKGDKVKVFKKKRRKGYSVLNGHRQFFTELQVQEIAENATAKKKAVVAQEDEKTEQVEAKKEAKTSPVKETAEKKETAKKTTAESTAEKPKAKTTTKESATKKAAPAKKAAAPKTKAAASKTKAAAPKSSAKKEDKGESK